MKQGKKIQKRLDARIKDFNNPQSFAGQPKVEYAYKNGGFTQPGSRKKGK